MSIALITGGSRGLGKATALLLADRGIDSIITYKNARDEADGVVRGVEAKGRKAVALQLDVAESSTYGAFFEATKGALRKLGAERFDFLVNNAGIAISAAFADTTEEQFDELYNVHLKAAFFLTQKLLPVIADGGRIINITTGLTRFTYPGQSAYAAMKGGVETLTRYMARELAGRGIIVNAVAPGGIETDIGGGLMRNPEMQKAVIAQTPLGRMGQPDDVAGIVAALLEPGAGWMTGQRLELTGGFML